VRIVGGKYRGKALAGPKSKAIRPTGDRLRETIFNILAHGYDDACDGAQVLDLFAGTGALGLEAMSRGAASALFIEQAPESRALIRRNIEALGLTGVTKLFRRDATRLGTAGNLGGFDIVFADPPYGQGLAEVALASALQGGWISDQAICVIEEKVGVAFEPPAGLVALETRIVGESQVVFLRREA